MTADHSAKQEVVGARARWWRHAPILVILAGVALAYFLTAARFVLGHDHGEYVVVGSEGGLAHPPGYPLYILWLRAFGWMPAASAAHRTSLATGVLGLLALVILYHACRRWYVSSGAAAAAVALYGFSGRVWLLNTHAENLALNALLAAGVVLVAAPNLALRPASRAGLIGLLAGLGLANHISLLLMAPLAGWALWRAFRPSAKRLNLVATTVVGVGAGLAPYAYAWQMTRQSGDRWVWADGQTFSELVARVLRSEYGTFRITGALDAGTAPLGERLMAFTERLAADLLWAPALIGTVALVWGSVAALRARRPMLGPAMLALTFVLTGPVMVYLNTAPPQAFDGAFVARFDILPEMIIVIFFARALHQLEKSRKLRVLLPLLGPALALVSVPFSLPLVTEYHRPTVQMYLENTLDSLPQNAVVLGGGDLALFGCLYEQRIQARRRDVVHIAPPMLFRRWYRNRIERSLGATLNAITEEGVRMSMLAEELIATGRPLFLLDVDENYTPILTSYPNHPWGTAVRVLPKGTAMPPTEQIENETRALFQKYHLEERLPRPRSFGAMVYWQYYRPWHFLELEYREQHKKERANDAGSIARSFEVR